MRIPYNESAMQKEIKENRISRKERIQNDIEKYGGGILNSEEMQKAFTQTHHQRSTVGEHTIRVAVSSMLMCYALKKMHFKINVPAIVVGSLCHDLGIIGREEKYSSNKECSREHPRDSVAVAKELVSDLSAETEEIIKRHMWPIGNTKAPHTIEGIVVSLADKYAAVKDFANRKGEK